VRILFWCATLAGLAHFAASSLGRPGSPAYAARCRQALAIRLTETLTVLLYLAVVPLAGWDFAFSPLPAAIGLALAVAGVALCVWAKVHLKTNFTVTLGIKQDHALITSGPYALVRHPIYTGFLLQILGGALLYDSGATLLLLFLPFLAFFYWQSVAEEKLLVDRFGDAYHRYRLTTGRLLPRLRKGESHG
jgi:protein-S-isoprenylcysteine O-methyltransferase Ste14